MRAPRLTVALLLLLGGMVMLAKTPGVFRGTLLHDSRPGWVYVKGRNGSMRRVEVSKARIRFNQAVPAKDRRDGITVADIHEGAEVRVLAEQDGSGEWRASEIEILRLSVDLPEPSQRSRNIRTT